MFVEAEMAALAPMPVVGVYGDARGAGIADTVLDMPAIAFAVAGDKGGSGSGTGDNAARAHQSDQGKLHKFFHENLPGQINGAKTDARSGFAQARDRGVTTLPKKLTGPTQKC